MNSFLRLSKCYKNLQPSICKFIFPSHTGAQFIHSSVISGTPLLKTTVQPLVFSRKFWETFPLSTRSLYAKDGLNPNDYELVYHSRLFNYVFYGQFFSELTLSVQFIASSYHAYQSYVNQVIPSTIHFGQYVIHFDAVTIAVLMLFTLQNVIVLMATRAALLRVYHKMDTDEYVLVSLSLNPFKAHLTQLKAGNLKPLYIKNLLAIFGNYKCKEKKIFIKHAYFKNLWYYNHLVGSVDKESFYQ